MAGEQARGAELSPILADQASLGALRSRDDVTPPPARAPGSGAQLAQLGGARADFVAALGRRVSDMLALVREIERLPGSSAPRDDLRRRLHALAAGARLLRFARVAERVCEGEAILVIAADRGLVSPDDLANLRTVLEELPSLAWADAETRDASPSSAPPRGRTFAALATTAARRATGWSTSAQGTSPRRGHEAAASAAEPVTALVVGPEALAACLQSGFESAGGFAFEVERVDASIEAIDLARALAPDVIVLDTSGLAARELCAALMADPLTAQIPVVAITDGDRAPAVASFTALGVARALPRPVSPSALQRACVDAVAFEAGGAARSPIGEVTVDELAARLGEELRRSLGDAALASGRPIRFDMAEGTDVLAALWGAVARIRDLVTIGSSGRVRFSPTGPEGALPIAPWLGPEGERRGSVEHRLAEGPSLHGKVVVVADDDPAVTWFLSGVLRAEGAIVHDAHDGLRALALASRFKPDLVVSDIVMPGLDGLSLCRALKRDLVLRDVPVLLLSWKEDLLQRVRELGASADGYVRKEASAPVILERVREVLWARHRVGERIASAGEVRGRLDGLSTARLLGVVCAERHDATLGVRDANYLYEVDVRGGRPVRATRTSVDGAFERGDSVLPGLLGVSSGRFVVSPPVSDAISVELYGSLEEQLEPHVARARAAIRLVTGVELMAIDRIELDEGALAAYLSATPEPARTLLRAVASGASPRALVAEGRAPARLLEDVLVEVGSRGVIRAILAPNGDDLLPAAVERETDVLRGVRTKSDVLLPELDLGPVIYTSTPAPAEIVDALEHVARTAAPRVEIREAPRTPEPTRAALAPTEERPDVEGRSHLALEVAATAPSMEPRSAIRSLGSLAPPPVAPVVERAAPVTAKALAEEETPSRAVRKPSSYASAGREEEVVAPPPRPRDASAPNRGVWVLFAVAGIVFAIGARLSRDRELARTAVHEAPVAVDEKAPPSGPAPLAATPSPAVTGAATAEPAAPAKADGESKTDPILPQDAPLRTDDKVPPGQGMLEVVAGTSDSVFIDGAHVGNGPDVRRALAPRKEPYEIRVKLRGEERVRFAMVKEGRLTRIRIAPPWSR